MRACGSRSLQARRSQKGWVRSPPALAPCLAPLLRGSQREVSMVLSLFLQWLAAPRAVVSHSGRVWPGPLEGPAAFWGRKPGPFPVPCRDTGLWLHSSPPAQPVPPMGRTLVEEPTAPVCFVHDLVLFLLPRASEEVWITGTSFLRWPQAAGKPLPRARGDSCTPAEAWGQLCQLPHPCLGAEGALAPLLCLGPGIFSRRASWAPLGRHNGLEYSETLLRSQYGHQLIHVSQADGFARCRGSWVGGPEPLAALTC